VLSLLSLTDHHSHHHIFLPYTHTIDTDPPPHSSVQRKAAQHHGFAQRGHAKTRRCGHRKLETTTTTIPPTAAAAATGEHWQQQLQHQWRDGWSNACPGGRTGTFLEEGGEKGRFPCCSNDDGRCAALSSPSASTTL